MKGKIYMYIQPNSRIWICHGVPLDDDYDDTYVFTDPQEQFDLLINPYLKHRLEKYHYQRVNVNYLKVEIPADDLYDCNYMAFTNSSYTGKIFYAFIKDVEYINDNVSQINYEIDVIQTWHLYWELGECFVEREHSILDGIGENLVDEELDTGEYVIVEKFNSKLNDKTIVFFTTFDEDYKDVVRLTSGDGYSISGLYAWMCGTIQEASQWLEILKRDHPLKYANGIVSACIMPSLYVLNFEMPYGNITIDRENLLTMKRSDGSDVKNQKCLTYPYNFLYITNNQGLATEYRIEQFDGQSNIVFNIYGDITPSPSAMLVPVGYKGISENKDEAISLTNFPQISWNVDSFVAWLAQSASNNALTTIGTVGTATAIASGAVKSATAVAGATIGAGVAVAGIVAKGIVGAMQPAQAKGNQNGMALNNAGMLDFGIYYKRIKPEFVDIVDDYFSAYGYACHKVKVPNYIFGRPSWQYVKTIGAVIKGNINAGDKKKIKDIFDKGIRFWKAGKTIGDYTQNNNPVI